MFVGSQVAAWNSAPFPEHVSGTSMRCFNRPSAVASTETPWLSVVTSRDRSSGRSWRPWHLSQSAKALTAMAAPAGRRPSTAPVAIFQILPLAWSAA